MEKCVYCGKRFETGGTAVTVKTREFPVCGEACGAAAEDYIVKDKKYKTAMYLMIFIAAVGILVCAVTGRSMVPAYCVQILAGIAFFLFPYPISSFESFQSCPIRAVKLVCRVIGIIFAVFGVYLLVTL